MEANPLSVLLKVLEEVTKETSLYQVSWLQFNILHNNVRNHMAKGKCVPSTVVMPPSFKGQTDVLLYGQTGHICSVYTIPRPCALSWEDVEKVKTG